MVQASLTWHLDLLVIAKMGRQQNKPQRKEKEESPRKKLNKTEATNMSEKEFRVMITQFINLMKEKINKLCKNQEEVKSGRAINKNK